MKTDEFENQLKRQQFRKVPEGWRDAILAQAEAAQPVSRSQALPLRSWWRELLWPCPQAWAGLAVAWIVLLAINTQIGVPEEPPMVKAGSRQLSPETLMVLQQQRQLRLELTGSAESPAVAEPTHPRPRTHRDQQRVHA